VSAVSTMFLAMLTAACGALLVCVVAAGLT
jgi:hypothetical protein